MKSRSLILFITLATFYSAAFAAGTGGGAALPWEGGLTAIVGSFTGPVAYAVSVLGIIIGIGILIFGNDLNAFGRTIVFLILAASVIVTAANTLQIFTGVGATTSTESLGMLALFLTLVAGVTLAQESFLRLFQKSDKRQICTTDRS